MFNISKKEIFVIISYFHLMKYLLFNVLSVEVNLMYAIVEKTLFSSLQLSSVIGLEL